MQRLTGQPPSPALPLLRGKREPGQGAAPPRPFMREGAGGEGHNVVGFAQHDLPL